MSLTDDDKRWIQEELAQMEARLNSRIDRAEAAPLAGYQESGSETQARRRSVSAALRAIELELEAFSDRLKELEGRK